MQCFIRAFAVLSWVVIVMSPSAFADETRAADQQSESKEGYDVDGLLRISPDFFELSAATGGDFYFWAPAEFSSSSLRIPAEQEIILLAYGVLDRSIRTFDFVVDSKITRVAMMVGAQEKLNFTLIRPDGVVVNGAHEGVDLQHYQHMLIATVDDPQPGQWSFETQGAGRFSLSVRAKIAGHGADRGVELIDFTFVELRGRPGHEGYFENTAALVAGTNRLCKVTLSGQWKTARIVLVSNDGSPLTSVKLTAKGTEHSNELMGTCAIPSQPFRVVVTGLDSHDIPFMRTFALVFEPKGATHDKCHKGGTAEPSWATSPELTQLLKRSVIVDYDSSRSSISSQSLFQTGIRPGV